MFTTMMNNIYQKIKKDDLRLTLSDPQLEFHIVEKIIKHNTTHKQKITE